MKNLQQALGGVVDEVERRRTYPSAVVGLATGFTDLDEGLGGLDQGSLVVVGGRPGMGKTALVLGSALHTALQAYPVAIFSLEMSSTQVARRLLASDARVDSMRLRSGQLLESDYPKISNAIERIGAAPLLIGERLFELDEIVEQIRTMSNTPSLIVIDGIQLMRIPVADEYPRHAEISVLVRVLKRLAVELDTVVMITSPLSRSLENRADKRPIMTDLYDSGSLESGADVVLFIYRDDMYYPDSADRGTAEIHIAKHRHGPTGMAELAFVSTYARFANMARV